MLSTEQRKNRLEELLARVRQNRGRLEASRDESDALPAVSKPPKAVRTYNALPDEMSSIPASPVSAEPETPSVEGEAMPASAPVEERAEVSAATAVDAIPTLETEPPEPVTAKVDFKDLAAVAEHADDRGQDAAAAEDVEEDEELERETLRPVPSADADQPPLAAEAADVPSPRVADEQPATEPVMKKFEPPLDTAAEVVSVTGAISAQWSLEAVLKRAWKLGMKE